MNQAKKYRKYYEALDLIGCKHVSTSRQIKNGTRVFRLPFRDAYDCDIDFAVYESGYVRKLCKIGYAPCYQINKTRKMVVSLRLPLVHTLVCSEKDTTTQSVY